MCCAVLAGWVAFAPSVAGRRLRRLDPVSTERARRQSLVEQPTARAVICVSAGVVAGWLLFGIAGAVVGVPVGFGLAVWIGRLETPEQARIRLEIGRDLPLAADLLAACASVGGAPEQALPIVSRAIGGSLGMRLDEISARLALGADPVTEWRRCAQDPRLAAFGQAMARAAQSGAPLADGLAR